jgi:hypothetical protein
MKIRSIALAMLLAAGMPVLATAQPAMIASTPGTGSTAQKLSVITMGFNAPLQPGTAGAEIVMTAMPGMTDHPPMVIKAFTTAMSDDGKTLTLALRKPLPAGTYTVKWSATGADNQRTAGTLDFAVK